MQISKHAYGQVFESLLDGLKGDVVLTKTAAKNDPAPITGIDVFSSQTADTLRGIQEDEFNAIINELQFAADKAKIALAEADVATFVSRAYKDSLKGKALEREASHYCNQLNREIAPPEGTTRLNADQLYEFVTSHKVVNASYNPDASINETDSSGRYMGCIRNPNSIWDSQALQEYASVKHGDERIKSAQVEKDQKTKVAKQQMWDELSQKLSDPNMVQKGIIKSANTTAAEPVVDQKLASNAMSIFSEDREFQNIPEKSVGELIKEAAKNRAEKAKTAEARADWDKSEPAKKASNTLDGLFAK
jgi:hypothetical protein